MCGGGGGRAPAPDPVAEARAQMMVLQEQARLQAQQEAEARARQQAEEERRRGTFNERLTANRQGTLESTRQAFQGVGLDPMEYEDRIMRALDDRQRGLTFESGNADFGTDFGTNLLDTIRGERVRELTRAVNEFAPEGFATQRFGDTYDDAILDSILADRYQSASDQILRARDRGTLTDVGFDYAMRNLDTQRTAAASRLQDTGGGVLSRYRDELRGLADNARTGAQNFDFGSTFDPNFFRERIETRGNELSSRLEGDIRSAIGGEQFFDVNSLVQRAGVNQGPQNPIGSAIFAGGNRFDAINRQRDEEEQSRGLGTRGAF